MRKQGGRGGWGSRRLWGWGAAAVVAAVVGTCVGCNGIERRLISVMTPRYKLKEGSPSDLRPTFEGSDADRRRIFVTLVPVAKEFPEPTDIQFPPGETALMVVLQKGGVAKWVSLPDGKQGELLSVDVLTESEEGLLGLAFHPRFKENGRFFLNYVTAVDGKDTSRIEEWTVAPGSDLRTAKPQRGRVILEVGQPYQNHNAGQLAFGPDGYLYVGFGDGGFRDDPHQNGQNPKAMLGKMLRLDVDGQEDGKGYRVPKDNPFVGKDGYLPEIWALGLRNPWRYAFDSKGRLVVADVGQDAWEEIDLIDKGANYGWRLREGRRCYIPKECNPAGLTDPVYEYPHDEGQSITGGYVYEGNEVPALKGKYVFGDFVRGRLWAVDLPEKNVPGAPLLVPYTLGHWPILPTTFGRDAKGELYVADFNTSTVFAIRAAE